MPQEKTHRENKKMTAYDLLHNYYSAAWLLTVVYALWQAYTPDKSTKRMITGIIGNTWGMYLVMYLQYTGKI
jgi:hypothetical protein